MSELVLVCGSRGWTDQEQVASRLRLLSDDTTIIQGGASGADYLARKAVIEQGRGVITCKPNWNRYGKRAGIMRNLYMLDLGPSLVIAFWDGVSPGTYHVITEARRRGISVEVWKP